MKDEEILNTITDFVKDRIKSNLEMGVKINNPIWLELLIQNIENEFGKLIETRLDLQLELAEIVSNLIRPHLK
jgi:hypothetical protein